MQNDSMQDLHVIMFHHLGFGWTIDGRTREWVEHLLEGDEAQDAMKPRFRLAGARAMMPFPLMKIR